MTCHAHHMSLKVTVTMSRFKREAFLPCFLPSLSSFTHAWFPSGIPCGVNYLPSELLKMRSKFKDEHPFGEPYPQLMAGNDLNPSFPSPKRSAKQKLNASDRNILTGFRWVALPV